jgi:cobalt/nickel transport system permease protein
MMYRYVFVLLRMAEDTHLAKRARTITPSPPSAERRWIGDRAGALFSRSRHLAEEVYAAMLARGYTGEAKALAESTFGLRESLWLTVCAATIALTLVIDRVVLRELLW